MCGVGTVLANYYDRSPRALDAAQVNVPLNTPMMRQSLVGQFCDVNNAVQKGPVCNPELLYRKLRDSSDGLSRHPQSATDSACATVSPLVRLAESSSQHGIRNVISRPDICA